MAAKLGIKVQKTAMKLKSAEASTIDSDGVCDLWVQSKEGGPKRKSSVMVTNKLPRDEVLLLGMPGLKSLHILSENFPEVMDSGPTKEEEENDANELSAVDQLAYG